MKHVITKTTGYPFSLKWTRSKSLEKKNPLNINGLKQDWRRTKEQQLEYSIICKQIRPTLENVGTTLCEKEFSSNVRPQGQRPSANQASACQNHLSESGDQRPWSDNEAAQADLCSAFRLCPEESFSHGAAH